MRAFLKKAAELVLSNSGLPALARRYRAGHTVILAYHNIVPAGERSSGDSSLHLTQRQFSEQLDAIAETHQVISLSDYFTAQGSDARPRAIITIDDAYQGAMTAGMEELARRRLPATMFVAPAFIGGRSFWWDMIAAGNDGVLPSSVRQHSLTKLAGRHDAIMKWTRAESIRTAEVLWHETAATEQQLGDAVASAGITYGSHTWSHPNLAALAPAELNAELTRPLEWLRTRFTSVVPWIAYPYGLRSPETEKQAAENDYEGGLLIEGVPQPDMSRYAIPRLNIPAGVSVSGFNLRVSGVIPFRS